MPPRRVRGTDGQKKVVVFSRHPVTAAGFLTLTTEAEGYDASGCTEPGDLPARLEKERPDVVVIDVSPELTLDLLNKVRSLVPLTAVILWADSIAPEFLRQAIELGVRGVLDKHGSLEVCAECLKAVAAGRVWLEDELSRKMLSTRTVRLTPREGQIIGLLTQGLRNKEIAFRMRIAEGTAKAYLTRLYQKTGANDRFELALFAYRNLAVESVSSGAGPDRASVPGKEAAGQFRPTSLASLRPGRGSIQS